ncbi:GNAT family N-acetyltransferase [Acetobacteraceae bacterium H6797]|nr:GNAT family N-acetyltransferase [Acetobacteraceae bacterium H6797]
MTSRLTETGLDRGGDAGFGEIRSSNLGVLIGPGPEWTDAAQALRYKVFYEEMGAAPDAATLATKRDVDVFDSVADHLLVVDHDLGEGPESIVGTYRLIRRQAADRIGRFYSASEYDLTDLLNFPGQVLELGRSCVDERYRNKAAMQLLWQGIAAYVTKHQIDIMFGCASLPGTDLDALAVPLTYLHANHLAPKGLRPRAIPERFTEMRRMDPEAFDAKRALAGLPPLIKGYLRLGGFVGDGAVVDDQFNTTDVCIVVKSDLITDKYAKHYERKLASTD